MTDLAALGYYLQLGANVVMFGIAGIPLAIAISIIPWELRDYFESDHHWLRVIISLVLFFLAAWMYLWASVALHPAHEYGYAYGEESSLPTIIENVAYYLSMVAMVAASAVALYSGFHVYSNRHRYY